MGQVVHIEDEIEYPEEGHLEYDIYEHAGVQWVPHYTIPGIYVAPGGLMMSEAGLKRAGATLGGRLLWKREWGEGRDVYADIDQL